MERSLFFFNFVQLCTPIPLCVCIAGCITSCKYAVYGCVHYFVRFIVVITCTHKYMLGESVFTV